MKNQNEIIEEGMKNNDIELTKAEGITQEIAEQIRYRLHDDNFIFM